MTVGIRDRVRVGDILEVGSPRGSFTLESDDRPVVSLRVGIGATLLLAMLYAMSSSRSRRPVSWLHAARGGKHFPFAAEIWRLASALSLARSYVCFSRPEAIDRLGTDFDAVGRLSRAAFNKVGVSPDAEVYLCGRPRSWRI
jgi:ferredoxin-NADP reductase